LMPRFQTKSLHGEIGEEGPTADTHMQNIDRASA
jgi:hypothetical protein